MIFYASLWEAFVPIAAERVTTETYNLCGLNMLCLNVY